MIKKWKRILAAILAMAMMLSIVPVSAFAASSGIASDVTYTYTYELKNASKPNYSFTAPSTSSENVTLTNDVTDGTRASDTSTISFSANASDGSTTDPTITYDVSDVGVVVGNSDVVTAVAKNDGSSVTVTFTGGSTAGTTTVTVSGGVTITTEDDIGKDTDTDPTFAVTYNVTNELEGEVTIKFSKNATAAEYASGVAKYLTATYDTTQGGYVLAQADINKLEGALTRTGYTLVGFYTDLYADNVDLTSATKVTENTVFTTEDPSEEITVYAAWKADETVSTSTDVYVTYMHGGDYAPTPSPAPIKEETVTLTNENPTATPFDISGATDGTDAYSLEHLTYTTVNGDTYLTAVPTDDSATSYYKFTGWIDSKTGGTEVTEITASGSIYANWKKVDAIPSENEGTAISFYLQGGVFDDNSTKASLYYDETGALFTDATCLVSVDFPSDPTKEGYIFVGWYTTSELDKGNTEEVTAGTDLYALGDSTIYAIWEEKGEEISFYLQGGAFDDGSTRADLYYDETGALFTDGTCFDAVDFPSDPTKDGYIFVGWYTTSELDKGNTAEVDADTDLYTLGDSTIYAIWEEKGEAISFYLQGGEFEDGSTRADLYYDENSDLFTDGTCFDAVDFPSDPTKEGYIFVGWYTTSELDKGNTAEVDADTDLYTLGDSTIYAIWVQEYTVHFNSNGGGYTYTETVTSNVLLTGVDGTVDATALEALEAALSLKGYEFTGWNTKKDNPEKGEEVTADYEFTAANLSDSAAEEAPYDVYVYAQWEAVEYTVTLEGYDDVSGDAVWPVADAQSDIYTIEEAYALPALADTEDYYFGGWYEDADFTTPVTPDEDGNVIAVGNTGDVTYYAKWIPIFEVTFFGTDGSTVLSTVETDENYQVAFPDSYEIGGYTFTGWFTAEVVSWWPFEIEYTDVDEDDKFYDDTWVFSSFEANEYIVNFVSEGEIVNTEVVYGAALVREYSISRTGYDFTGWYADESLATEWNFWDSVYTGELVEEEEALVLYLYAGWDAQAVTVTFDSQEGSSVADATTVYDSTVTEPTDPTRDGYTFTGWYTDADCTSAWSFDTTIDDTVATPVRSRDGDTWAMTLYAGWEVITYTITAYDVNDQTGRFMGNGRDPSYKLDTYNIETGYEFEDKALDGYYFGGYYTDAALTKAMADIAVGTFGDVTVYVKWIPIHDISFFDMDGNLIEVVETNEDYTVNLVTAESVVGYDFDYWCTGSWIFFLWVEDEEVTAETVFEGDTKVYSAWKAQEAVVSFDSNGGSDVADETIAYDGTVTEPTDPTLTGYTFTGWYLENGTEWDFGDDGFLGLGLLPRPGDTVTEDVAAYNEDSGVWEMTLYAGWEAQTVYVAFDSQEGTAVDTVVTTYDAILEEPVAPTRTGYTFEGWYTVDGAEWIFPIEEISIFGFVIQEAYDGDIITEDVATYDARSRTWSMTLYADWEAIEYTVSACDINDQTGEYLDWWEQYYAERIGTYTIETGYVFEDLTRDGYYFGGYYTDKALTTPALDLAVGEYGNVIVYVKWIPQHEVTFMNADGTVFDVVTTDEDYNAQADGIPALTGYDFDYWYMNVNVDRNTVESVVVNPDNDLTVFTGDTTVYPAWDAQTVVVNFKSNGGSNVAAMETVYDAAVAQPRDPSRDYYNFVNWVDANGRTWNFATTIDTRTAVYNERDNTWYMTLYADWTPIVYSITYDFTTYGEALDDVDYPTTYTVESESFQLPEAQRDGYSFNYWRDQDGDKLSWVTTGSHGDIVVTANWEYIEVPEVYSFHMINVTYEGEGTITPATDVYGAYALVDGTMETFRFTPDAGYQVSAVYVDGVNVGAVSYFTFSNLTKDHTVHVVFSANGTASTTGHVNPQTGVDVG